MRSYVDHPPLLAHGRALRPPSRHLQQQVITISPEFDIADQMKINSNFIISIISNLPESIKEQLFF
jgi:hypothetical protein